MTRWDRSAEGSRLGSCRPAHMRHQVELGAEWEPRTFPPASPRLRALLSRHHLARLGGENVDSAFASPAYRSGRSPGAGKEVP